jgi:hypothetical protein
VGTVRLQSPELYAAAAALEFLNGTLVAMEGYDFEFSIQTLANGSAGNEDAYAAMLNAHFLHVIASPRFAEAEPHLLEALGDVVKGVDAVTATTSVPTGALFDWTAAPTAGVADIRLLATSAQAMLAGMTPIPFFTPAASLDASTFISQPLDDTGCTLFISQGTNNGITEDWTCQTNKLAPRFSPSPFGQDVSMSIPSGDFPSDSGDNVVKPTTDRYKGVWNCSN